MHSYANYRKGGAKMPGTDNHTRAASESVGATALGAADARAVPGNWR